MTLVRARPRPVPSWAVGLVEQADADIAPLGSIESGENFVPVPGGGLRTRGGSRILITLLDGSSNAVAHVPLVWPFTPTGMIAIGWSDALNKHYAYRLTANGAVFETDMATSRHDLTGMAAGAWNNGTVPARPVAAELWEKLFVCDATTTYASRNTFFSIVSAGTLVERTFAFGAGSVQAIRPYCLEEYNGVLFIAGYGTEDSNDADRPEMVRHSFLGKSPDASDGFDPFAFNLFGAKGQRVTAMRKGKGLLLVAKDNELYRVSGFGRAYPGWQYTIENVDNTAGLGVSNPHALCYAEVDGTGYWYGVGKTGPFRTDGFATENLVGPRQQSWRGINQTEYAWVTFHPDKRVILFGLHPSQATSGRSTTYPWKPWVWDIDRSVWTTDWPFTGLDIFMAVAVPAGTIANPAGPPTSPATATITTTGFTANWTTGDAGAETEVWMRVGAFPYTLAYVIAAGTNTKAVTGLTNHRTYQWKVRHRIGSVYTDFATEQTVQTLMAAPTIDAAISTRAGIAGAILDITVTVAASDTTTLEVEESADGMSGWSVISSTVVAQGTQHIYAGTCGQSVRAISRDAAWTPDASDYSSGVGTDCSGLA